MNGFSFDVKIKIKSVHVQGKNHLTYHINFHIFTNIIPNPGTMKKRITLIACILCAGILTIAQTPKDPQQELNQMQQKIRTLQSADQQIKGQVSIIKKDQAGLEQQVRTSLNAGDSAIRAGLDSVRVANSRLVQVETDIASLRSSLSLQQNLVIIALVLVICLVLLFLWQRRIVRAMAQVHEEDIKKTREMAENASADLLKKMDKLKEEFSSQHIALRDNLETASRKAESRADSVKELLSADLSKLDDRLRTTDERISLEHRNGLETEKTHREKAFAELNKKISNLDEKVDSSAVRTFDFLKQEAETHRKELSEIRKSIQEVSRIPKGRGNSAE
jgi:hypothetical protein